MLVLKNDFALLVFHIAFLGAQACSDKPDDKMPFAPKNREAIQINFLGFIRHLRFFSTISDLT